MAFGSRTAGKHPFHGIGCACHRPELQQASRRLDAFSRRQAMAGIGGAWLTASAVTPAMAQPAPPKSILFRQARLFDGTADGLRPGMQVLVQDGTIAAVDAAGNPPPQDALVIDCADRVLMPGLIDAHWHSLFAAVPVTELLTGDPGAIFTASTAEAQRTLLRGFTTIRDLGGPAFTFKQAIDRGVIPGPRIYPSGAMITTSGGHADLRMLSELPRNPDRLSLIEKVGGAMITDSLGELRMRIREQLLQGASQVKLVGGGGVSSPRSPLDMSTFGEAELRAAVEVVQDWNTYMTVHAFAPNTVQRSIAAGVACIEHAHLMDDRTAELMAEKKVWLSTQPFLSEADSVPLTGPSRDRLAQVIAGTPRVYALARKHGIQTAWGSDILFSPQMTPRQGTMLAHLGQWYSNAEALRMATSVNGALLARSGPRNPYPGKLGVVQAGALADLILVNGDPLADLGLVADPARNFQIIMKGGVIHKNTLGA